MNYAKVIKPELKCEYDSELKIIIHRFGITACVCQCGEISVDAKKTDGGWRKLHVTETKK